MRLMVLKASLSAMVFLFGIDFAFTAQTNVKPAGAISSSGAEIQAADALTTTV